MPIQTSSITTSTDGDLTLDPNGTGKVVMTDLAAGTTKQVAVDATGNVQNLDVATLPLASNIDDGDLVVIQAGATQNGLTAGQIYKADAGNLSGRNAVDPSPSQITATPAFIGGDGSPSDPFVLTPAVVAAPGGTAESAQLITITSTTGGIVHMEDISAGDAFGKFTQQNGAIPPSGGSYSFRMQYADTPRTPEGSGHPYQGLIKLGATTVYFSWVVAQVSNATDFGPISSPNASPATVDYAGDGKYGTVTATWKDGPMQIQNQNGKLAFSVNNGVKDYTLKDVVDGDIVRLSFTDSVVAAAGEGDTIAGVLYSTDQEFLLGCSMVKDTTPGVFAFPAQTNVAISTVVTSASVAIDGINAITTVTAAVGGTNAMTSIEVSVAGGAFTSTFPINYSPGDTIQVRGTTGAVAGTGYSAVVTVGGVNATFLATTGTVAASLVTPTILTPGNFDGTLQAEDVSVVSSTAARVDGSAVTHQSSTWEAYKALAGASPEFLETDTITASSLTGTTSTVTVASNTDLSRFTPGERVQQDASYFPKSSTITTVQTVSYTTGTWSNVSGAISSSPTEPVADFAYIWDANSQTKGFFDYRTVNNQSSRYKYTFPTPISFTKLEAYVGSFSSSATATVGFNGGAGSQGGNNGTVALIDFTAAANAAPGATAGILTSFEIGTDSDNYAYIGQILVDGQPLGAGSTQLTFTNNQDLAFFQAGDLVQTDSTFYSGLQAIDETAGNGNLLNYFVAEPDCTSQGIGGDTYDFTGGDIYVHTGDVIYTKGWLRGTNPTKGTVRWILEDGTNLDVTGLPVKNDNSIFTDFSEYGQSTSVTYTGPTQRILYTTAFGQEVTKYSYGIAGIYINGVKIVNGQQGPVSEYRILNVQPASNLLTTNGGKWLGSNGSGTAGGDTQVTDQTAKQGKGLLSAVDTSTNQLTINETESLFIPNTNSGSGTGSPTAFVVQDVNVPGTPVPPSTDPPAAANYSLIDQDVDDTTQLTNWTPTGGFPGNSSVFVRVKYKDNTTLVSDFSDWSGFETQGVPQPAQPAGGGYFAGQILDGSTIYNIIVCPAATGQITSATAYQTAAASGAEATQAQNYGGTTSDLYDQDSGYPAFFWLSQVSGPNAGPINLATGGQGGGAGVGGYTDWYLPAKNELELCYFSMKPTTQTNSTAYGENNAAVPPRPDPYTEANPPQSSSPLFKQGGSQAFDASWYWSSSQNELGSSASAWGQRFNMGEQSRNLGKNEGFAVRAIRRYAA